VSTAPRTIGPRRLHVRGSRLHGLGVFSAVGRQSGELLEVSPVLEVPAEQVQALRRTSLGVYYFWWPPDGAAVALGYGSLYNHSYLPNARYELEPDDAVIVFTALRPIAQNEEITVNYNGDASDLTPVWFHPVQ
jgi:uncharacterized protein